MHFFRDIKLCFLDLVLCFQLEALLAPFVPKTSTSSSNYKQKNTCAGNSTLSNKTALLFGVFLFQAQIIGFIFFDLIPDKGKLVFRCCTGLLYAVGKLMINRKIGSRRVYGT